MACLGSLLFLYCAAGEEGIPLPTNPHVKFALPRALLSLNIFPDTIDALTVSETSWELSEVVGTGFGIDIQSNWIEYYTPAGELQLTTNISDLQNL